MVRRGCRGLVVGVLHQAREVARPLRHDLAGRVVEALRPVVAALVRIPVHPAQVVHHVAARHDEDALVEERREAGAEVDVVLDRLARIDRELDNGDVGIGEHVREHRPGAVVDAPAVDVHADPDGFGDLGDLLGEGRGPRRGVVEVEQGLREPVEVVDDPRGRHRGDDRGVHVPVRRDAEHRPRACRGIGEGGPGLGVAVVLDRVHRVPMADEGGGHRRHAPVLPGWWARGDLNPHILSDTGT